MSFTRFHDDPIRIQKQLQESSFAGRYMLNAPGPGAELPFFEDPNLRMQKWGANVLTNTVNLESDLRGLTRPLNRDLLNYNDYTVHSVPSSKVAFQSEQPFVEESRATHPAWSFRDLEQSRWEQPLLNPQDKVENTQFHTNIQTRILEKDHFTPHVPTFSYLSF